MKTTLITALAITGFSVMALSANINGEIPAKTMDTGKFYGLIVNTPANIILTQGEECQVRVEGDKRDTRKISTKVENGALVINGPESSQSVIYVSVEDINLIEVNSDARVFVRGILNSDILLIKVNHGGVIRADIRSLKVGLIARENGKIVISGSTGESYERTSGRGTIDSDNLGAYITSEEKIAMNTEKEKVKKSVLNLHK